MTCGDCGQSSCCCGQSLSGLRAGIHPDLIKSASIDLVLRNTADRTFETAVLINVPAHIVSVTACFMATYRNEAATTDADLRKQIQQPSTNAEANIHNATPAAFSLFTIPNFNTAARTSGGLLAHPDSEDGREYITTGAVTAGAPAWKSPDDLFGYFCDGGLFVEYNAWSREPAIRVVVNYIERAAFSPAYKDPVQTLLHYWNCAHPDKEFLEGFYTGVAFDADEDTPPSTGAPSGTSGIGTTTGTEPLSTDFTSPTSFLTLLT